jgi:hypothetical protein
MLFSTGANASSADNNRTDTVCLLLLLLPLHCCNGGCNVAAGSLVLLV